MNGQLVSRMTQGLFLLVFFSVNAMAQTTPVWEPVTDPSVGVATTPGYYDRRARDFASTVTVTNGNSAAIDGEFRVVVESSNKTPKSADGTTAANEPYYLLPTADGSALQPGEVLSKQIRFVRGRGRLHYSVRLEKLPPPAPPAGGTLLGDVVDTNGNPVLQAAVQVGTNTVHTNTGSNGSFDAEFGPDEIDANGQVLVSTSPVGFVATQAKVSVGVADTYTVTLTVKPVGAQQTIPAPNATPIAIDDGGTADLQIPGGAILDGSGNPVTEPVTVQLTALDPTNPAERPAFPGGDFLAVDPANPPAAGEFTSLDSVVLAEVKLIGDSGTEYSQLGAPATLELRIPDSLQASYTADDIIPIWFYKADTGLWVREGDGTVFANPADGGALWVTMTVSHFTWWNADQPVSTHACFKFSPFQYEAGPGTGQSLTGNPYYLDGISYNGRSRSFVNGNEVGLNGKKSATTGAEQAYIKTTVDGAESYLDQDDTDPALYHLTTDVNLATIFDIPTVQGNFNNNPQNCEPLGDPADPGVIEIDMNRRPVVTLSGPPASILPDAQVHIGALVNDPDNNLPNPAVFAWNATCGTLANETVDGADYTAPSLPTACTVSLSVDDDRGLTGSDSLTVISQGSVFVPGDQLRVLVVDMDGTAVEDAEVFLNDPLTGVPSAVLTTGSNGIADFSGGWLNNIVNLTVGKQYPNGMVRLATYNGIEAGFLTVVHEAPNRSGFQPSAFIGPQVAGALAQFDVELFASPTAPVSPAWSLSYGDRLLQPGDDYDPRGAYPGPGVPFDNVQLNAEDLQRDGSFTLVGLHGEGDGDNVEALQRYGFAVDQIPADVNGGLLPITLAQIPNDYLLAGGYQEPYDSVLIGRRKGRNFWSRGNRWNNNDNFKVRVMDLFPSDVNWVINYEGDTGELGFVLHNFQSQTYDGGVPLWTDERIGRFPNGDVLPTDRLEVSVALATPVFAAQSSVEVTLTTTPAGSPLDDIGLMRTDFRGKNSDVLSIVWSVFDDVSFPSDPPVAQFVFTPELPPGLSNWAMVAADDSVYCGVDFGGHHIRTTAISYRDEAGDLGLPGVASPFYRAMMDAYRQGHFDPVVTDAIASDNDYFYPESLRGFVEMLRLSTTREIRGANGALCIDTEGPQ